MSMQSRGKYAVIVGCGKLGAYLAGALSECGCSVVVIDCDIGRFAELSTGFSGFTLEGDAIEFATMEQAKIGQAGLFFAMTGSDSVNLMTSQIARKYYNVAKVATRIYDPELEGFCRHMGLIPILPVTVTAEALLHTLGFEE